jgi:hypothetical protein
MAIVDLKKDYVAGNKTNFGGSLGKSTSKKEDSSFLGNLAYIGGNTAAGFGGVFEGIGRLVSSTGAKIAGDDRLARYYAKKSYIGEWQSDMADRYSPGKVTQFFADAGAGVGQSSVFLLNLVAPGAGTVVFGAGIFGNSVGEAVNKTGQLGFKEYAYGGLSAGGEVLMEVISGATFKAVGRIGAGVTGNLTKNAVETTATQTAKKGFLKAVASNAVLKNLLKESSGEFVEEFLGDFWDVGISRLTGVDPEASTTLGQAIYSGMVGFASGAMMSGSSMVINRAAAASRGYHINESGNAQQMVRTAEVVLEEAKTAENFQDPAGVVDMLKESVESYNAQKDKTNFASRVALGQMQMFTAYIEKNIGVMQAYANIMKADAQTLEKYAQLASYYTNEKVTTRDLLANRDNITTQMAIRDWVNGVLTVDSDLVAEAEVRDFTRTTEGGNTSESTGETRFSMTGDAAKQELKNQLDRNATAAQEAQQTAQATEITQTSFDGGKSVQNVHIIDRMYLSIKKNSDGTYNYAINDKSAKQDANGGVWDKTNVPAEEMRQYFEQAKEGAVQYEAQKAAQTDQETQTGADGKTTVKGENAAQGREGAEKKAQEKPRQKSEIDSATEKKLNKMVKGFNTMAYRDRVAVSRMVKSAEANGVDAKTVKKIAIAMTARSGLDIRFTKSISQNGTWTVFKDGSKRRLILLNPDIQSPLEQTFLHEFMHDMMHDQYTNMKAVMDVTSGMLEDGAFDNYVQERRDEYFDACAKAGREGLILTKNEDGTVTRSFASENAEKAFDLMMREEATANFGAEFLYRRGFLTRVARSNQKLVLRAFRAIGRWINDVRSRDMETARALEGYFRTIEDAVRNSKGNSEIASLLFGSKLDAQNAETKSAAEGSDTLYSLPAVSPVKPSSREWKTTIDTAEAKKRFPSLWDVTADESQTRNPTQIRSTVSTYRKIYDILKAEGFSGKILDASSGLGYGTRAGIDEYGFEVDDIEPYPDRSYSPKYTDYSALEGKYDAIISNAVLNVLPQDQRDALVVKMGKLLADGGKLFVNVRGDDVNTLSSNPSNVKIGDMEWFVSSTGSYQKGFTRNELVAYLKDALGNDFEVQGTSKFGKASAIVTKKESATNKSKTGNNTRFELSQFGQYTAEESSSIQRDAKNEIAKSYDDVKRFISDSTSENIQKRLFVGKIDKETAKNILAQTDVYTYGKSIVLTSDDIRHIFDRHGSAFSEGQRGQIAITADNFDSVLRTIMKPDTVKPEVDKSGAISLVFKKEINGNVTAVTVVSEKKKALSLKSAWITVQKEKQHISPPSDVQAPNPTSKTVGSMNAVSDNSIHQNSENVKGKSKIGENTRFELKIGSQTTPVKVQETKNLIAIHNLTEQNLLDTLNLGGFPMPSIAVIKADQGHSEYGDISVIFGKETIDPQINSKNAIYGGDAWTPTYPTIEYKVAEKVADRIRNKYYDLARKFGYDDVRPLYKYANDLEDTLNKAKGEAELISSLVDDEDMMRVFLMDSGKGKIPTVQTEVRTEMSPAEVERAKFFINALGEDVVRGIKTPEGERIGFYRQKYLDEHSDAIRNVYHELLTKEYGATEEEAQRVLENAKRYDLFRIVNDAYHYLENGGVTVRTETDSAASSKAVRDAVDTKQYRTWLKDIFGGIEEKSGIRNERDPFDSRGNRRKWETLHWENTLENVVQAMLEQPDVGKGTIFSATSIWGVSAKEYKTISDMKKDTARLKTMSQQQYDTIRAGFEERLTAIADSIRDVKADNEFIARDNAISAIVEAVRTKKTGSSMLAYLKGYSNRATAQTVKDIISLVRDISDMPTQYFEAKPHRVVNFSEIKMVELPESASDTLKKQLERRKIPYEVYGKTDEDRATAVKKLNDVRFELNSGTGYSRGQMSKIVANRTKGKVYSLSDAAIAIDNVTALVSGILSDENISFRAKIRGKSRAEVMDFLFEQMNKEQGNGRLNTALQAADYILNHAVVQEELDSVGREEYARMMDIITGVESYRRKFKFTETEKADLKHMFDKGYPSLLRAWSSEDGMMPSRILAELKDSGITVDSASDVESDIFADLLGQYQNAKQAIKQWNESVLLNTVGDKRMLTKLKSDMAHEILKAFETTGEKSAYRKEVEARQESISKMLEKNRAKLTAARKRAMSESRLYRNAIKLDEQLKRDRRSSQLLSDERMRKVAESAAKIGKPRNARNPQTVRDWAKSMQEIYSPKNPLLAIYGEADEETGKFEHTYYSNEVGEALNRLAQIDTEVYRNGKKVQVKYLTDEQIVDLDTVISGITRLYRDYDTVYFQGKRQSLTETAQRGVDNMQWIADERVKKGKRFGVIDKIKRWTDAYLYEIASPMAVIHDMERHDPNGVLSAAFEGIVYGQISAQTMFADLMNPFETFYKENKGYKKALARDTVNFRGHELTKAQAISLYCTMKREHAQLGLETFGIVFDDKNGNRVKTGSLKGYDANALYKSFSETDKRFISLVENFFNDVSKKVKGDADMRIIGSTNVLDDYYFPILRDRSQRTNSVGDTRRGISDFLETVLNLSFNQNTVRHADGRIEISDVTNTIMKHAQGLAIYANLYEQIQTFDRILNKKVGEMDADGKLIRETTKSLGEMMEDNHKGMLNYLSKLLADVQGVRTDMTGAMDVIDHALTKVYGLYAQAAVSGNIKTAILPLASYFATGLYVDARHMAKGFAMNATPEEIRANMEQMDKYSSVTKGRYYDRGAIKSQTVQDEVRGLISVTGKGIEATERFMLSKVWNACKSQTAEQLGLSVDSDENCRAAAKLFDKVVIETQSQYVASMKSAMGRSKNQLVRGLTMFKSDGAAMFSSSFDAIRRFMDLRDRAKAGQDVGKELAVAKKRAGRAVASVASVCVAVAIITQAMRYAFNNDDEEEETPAKNIAMNTMNSAMGMFPLIGDVYSVFAEGYDISNMTLDALNDGINGVRGMVSLFGDKNATQADVARATRKALYGVGHMAGVPVRNLTNLTTGVIRRFSKPAMYGYDSIFSGEKYSEDLRRAVKRGDDKMAEAITKVMFRRKKTGAYNQETLDEVLRLYKAGYDKKVMPGGIPDDLTRAQRKTFLNVYGKSDADVQKLIESDAYKAFDDEQKASAISSLYRSWRAYAEYQATGETDDKSALLSEIMGADKFGKARAYLSGLKAKEDAETPKDGWRSTIQKGLKGMGLTSDEQALIIYAAGYHSASDLSAFLRVLNAKNLTKEQLALLAEIFKLDVKKGKLVERKTTKKTA